MSNLHCLLISPASIYDPKDPFTTGVVYMPIGLAYVASALRESGAQVTVFDIFGEEPKRAEVMGDYIRLGTSNEEMIKRIRMTQPSLIIFYANQVLNHVALIQSMNVVKEHFPKILVGVLENTQAVTSYLLTEVADELFDNNADFIISGESENVLVELVFQLQKSSSILSLNIDGLSTKGNVKERISRINHLDELSFPAWDLFPVKNYWDLGYAHGPFQSKSYLPLLTSRGCPFPCKFCVVPSTNNRKWRFRSPKNVVNEMEFMCNKYGVREFHLEDLNPTIQDSRMRELASEIIERGLKVNWKIVAGTKIESIKSIETLKLMNNAGLSYLSMSPESGSKKVLRDIGKPFDVQHAVTILRECYRLGIKTQACFVLGYPTESFWDRVQSLLLVIKLSIAGVDEIVVFIMSPIPGSQVYRGFIGQFDSLSSLSFSPRWRRDFDLLLVWRILMYLMFLLTKFIRNPKRMLKQIRNLWTGEFQTKMEMTPIRGFKYLMISRRLSNKKW